MWSRTIAAIAVLAPVWLGTPAIAASAKKQPPAAAQKLTPETVNTAAFSAQPAKPAKPAKADKASKAMDPVVLKAQILLDRAGFSPGSIDAIDGENYAKALTAFQRQNGLDGPASSTSRPGRSSPPPLPIPC